MRPKTKLFDVIITNQTHFRSFLPARHTEKVLGAISRFLRPKTKLFTVKYRRILDVVRLQNLQKKFWAHCHDFCIQKRSCLPWGSDVFWNFSACKIYRKSFGRIFTICVSHKQTFLTSTFCESALGTFYILRAHKFLLCCWDTLWSSWLSHFVRMLRILWIWTHLGCECTRKLWRTSVTLCEALWNKSWTDTSDMFCIIWTSKEWTDFVNIDLR